MLKLRACPQCGGDLLQDVTLEGLDPDRGNDSAFTCLQCGCSVSSTVRPAGELEPMRQNVLRGLAQAEERRVPGSHPSAEELEAVAFGWIAQDREKPIHAHTARCPGCRSRLAAEEAIHSRLALLQTCEVEPDLASIWVAEG